MSLWSMIKKVKWGYSDLYVKVKPGHFEKAEDKTEKSDEYINYKDDTRKILIFFHDPTIKPQLKRLNEHMFP